MIQEETSSSIPDFISELASQERQDLELELTAFSVRHASHHRPLALVTSGGTAVDLETRAVRTLENFSTGLRGAVSVEEFLKRGYAVIHLCRTGSASPYGRVVHQALALPAANHGLSITGLGKLFQTTGEELEEEDQMVQSVLEHQDPWLTEPSVNGRSNGGTGKPKRMSTESSVVLNRRIMHSTKLQTALKERQQVLEEGRLLTVQFRSVEEYLAKLQMCAESLRDSQSLAICYLAAAVSDFYLPKAERSEHKIQSTTSGGEGGLSLHLSSVPKTLGLLRQQWAPHAFVCSFKLETDKELLRTKAERAVETYGCHMVIGNLLHSRYHQVSILAPDPDTLTVGKETWWNAPSVQDWPFHEITRPRGSEPEALESLILDFVVQSHFEYISMSVSDNDSSGTEAVLKAHQKLEHKRREVNRAIFWKQVKATGLEWAGVAVGCVLSYVVSAALRRRMGG